MKTMIISIIAVLASVAVSGQSLTLTVKDVEHVEGTLYVAIYSLSLIHILLLDILSAKEKLKDRPMKGFIQVLQVLVFFIGGIVIVAIIVDKSPATLFAGLGASAAILMLVFKDSILGFVAGIQLLSLIHI